MFFITAVTPFCTTGVADSVNARVRSEPTRADLTMERSCPELCDLQGRGELEVVRSDKGNDISFRGPALSLLVPV